MEKAEFEPAVGILKGPKQLLQQPSRQQRTLIPDDVIEDILVNLPVKSLLRFKSVSKSWCSLISKPAFARANLNKRRCHSHDSLIPKPDHNVESKKINLPSIQSEFADSIYSCTDGIFCMGWYDGQKPSLFLWNPRINKYKMLPSPESFEELLEYICFGYDSSINDYKVARVLSVNPLKLAPQFLIQVLNVKSNVWRTVHKDTPYAIEIHRAWALYFRAEKTTIGSPKISIILRFDLAEESLQEVSMVPNVRADIFGLKSGKICTYDTEHDTWELVVDCGGPFHEVSVYYESLISPSDDD